MIIPGVTAKTIRNFSLAFGGLHSRLFHPPVFARKRLERRPNLPDLLPVIAGISRSISVTVCLNSCTDR